MAESRTELLRAIHLQAGIRRRNIGIERASRVRDVSSRWREGFLQLKAENDRLQAENLAWYRSEMAEVDAWVADQIEGLQR
jgi:hypothetical protein